MCCLKAQYANPGGWGQILAYMAFCEVSQEQTPGTDAYAGDFGFKVLTSSDPAEKTKKLNAEIANGRLAMMAIIGMFFQVGCGEKLLTIRNCLFWSVAPCRVLIGVLNSRGLKSCQESGATRPCMYVGR